ncbi:MAG: type VI secretion system baseplate subunit TssG [Neisseria sp.]|uniref:type VI secretion system baseplate subunit TssG n=1 Tax=Neisseria sp. TaxID=192066 RepID=UPI0026DAAC14|nr:type VI secretion system baseplate subunit TssG [Neisseria sp.]MDO4640971.1 type VI secretion system baseplate subunit TssG [Neisseria sp.]
MKPAGVGNVGDDLPEGCWDERLTGFLNKVASRPYRYDYFSLLRQLESVRFMTGGRLLGKAVNPKQEKIRVRQEPSLIFSPRNIQSVNLTPGYVEISINGFGLFGPSGPLPLHITEYAYERQHQHGDATWTGFANIFQHRLAVLFYRAWANAQSIVSLDKNAEDRFGKYIACLNGLDSPPVSNHNLVHEFSRRYFAGLLMKQSRSAANLQQLLTRYFKVQVVIQTNVGYWVSVSDEEKTQVGSEQGFTLGEGLLLGDKLYDAQSKFRIIVGPLTLEAYRSFYKKGFNTARLREWVRLFLADEYEWDVKPVLMRQEVPPLELGNDTQLGLSTWLGHVNRDAEDLVVGSH